MHENVFATLTADKAIALGVIEPLHCSLFHLLIVPFGDFYACMGVGRTGQALAVTREAAQNQAPIQIKRTPTLSDKGLFG
jgi:hypothetical protein